MCNTQGPTVHKPQRFIASARTNLPVWPAEVPAVDPAGRGFILIGIGDAASPVLEGWAASVAETGYPHLTRHAGDASTEAATLDWLGQALGQAVTGWRLMLAGPAAELLQLAARARDAGMIDAEIRAFAVAGRDARLHCIHCKTVFRADAGPGSAVQCPACQRPLMVHQHLSRRLSALLAFTTQPGVRS